MYGIRHLRPTECKQKTKACDDINYLLVSIIQCIEKEKSAARTQLDYYHFQDDIIWPWRSKPLIAVPS